MGVQKPYIINELFSPIFDELQLSIGVGC